MRYALSILMLPLLVAPVSAQTPPPAVPPVATDVTAVDIRAFIDALPKDRVSDLPIRVVPVTGDYRVGVYGVLRPSAYPGTAIMHRVHTTEIYYMLEGAGTLVTGGTLVGPEDTPNGMSVRGSSIEGGASRRVAPGDVVVIPGHTPHWWSELDGDISYLIFRPDPDNRLPIR